MWSIDFAFHEGRELTHGFEATREAAMQASGDLAAKRKPRRDEQRAFLQA
jgi:hypothetical protein